MCIRDRSKRRLSLPKVAYSAFLCVMMSMIFCQPAYAATDVWTKDVYKRQPYSLFPQSLFLKFLPSTSVRVNISTTRSALSLSLIHI